MDDLALASASRVSQAIDNFFLYELSSYTRLAALDDFFP